MSPPEKKYSVTELETLAVVWPMSHFHYHTCTETMSTLTTQQSSAVLDAPGQSNRQTCQMVDKSVWDNGKGVKGSPDSLLNKQIIRMLMPCLESL